MRIVLDTNVIISAFITRGVCRRLFEYCAESHQIVISEFILNEFSSTLIRKFGFTAEEIEEASASLILCGELVEPVTFGEQICRDPDDDHVLGTAIAGNADYIVTGDRDLLVLERFHTVEIISPSEFMDYEVGR